MRKELDGTLFRRASTIYSEDFERKYNFHSIFDSCLLGTRSFYIKSTHIWYSCDNIIFLVKGYLISAKWSRIGFEWVVIYNELMSSLQLYMRFWQNILALNICKLGNKCCFWSRHLTALVSSLLNKQSRLVMRLITHYCFLTRWSSTFFDLRRKMNPRSNPFFFLIHGDWYVLIKAVFIFSFRTKCVACQTDQSSSNGHVHLSWHPPRRRRLETFGKNAIKELVRAFNKKTFFLGYCDLVRQQMRQLKLQDKTGLWQGTLYNVIRKCLYLLELWSCEV